MDWSRLHTLELSPSISTLKKLRGAALPSLKYAAFSGNGDELTNATRGFLNAAVKPLKSISLQGISHSDTLLLVIGFHHAEALTNFAFGNSAGTIACQQNPS
jgi:hypothetical protein